MRRTFPIGGFINKLKRPEDLKLFNIASTLVEDDVGSEVTNAGFLIELMRQYVKTRNPLPELNSKPRL
jgi:hypothetical protein